jgi:RNA polymerase sigma-70 factor (ECF subfamily)
MTVAEFDELYERYGREVWALAYARRLDSDAALDVAQEAFLRLWMQDSGGEPVQNPRAWLLRVARNLADDLIKSAFRRKGTTEQGLLNGVPGRAPQALDALVQEERFQHVRELLRELPEADRELLTLKYALDYSTPAIAELLGIKVTAVHMRLSRARQRLAEKLTAHGMAPE